MKVWIDWVTDMANLPRIEWTNDKWIGWDKLYHAILHGVVAYFFMGMGCALGASLAIKLLIAGFTLFWTISFGGQYEMYDSARGVGASWRDMLSGNLVGWFIGTVIPFVVY